MKSPIILSAILGFAVLFTIGTLAEVPSESGYPIGGKNATDHPENIFDWDKVGQVNPDDVYGLNFEHLGLTAIPTNLARFKNLTDLDFSRNKIRLDARDIESLSQLHTLVFLGLGESNIYEIPPEIGKLSALTNLVSLTISGRSLVSVSSNLYRLRTLKCLTMGHVKFATLPDGISALTNLEYLVFDFSAVSSFPHDFAGLNLKFLHILKCHFNDQSLMPLPPTLIFMDAAMNQFTKFPNSLLVCTNIDAIGLARNAIDGFPIGITNLHKLTSISMAENQIPSIPKEVAGITNLINLRMDGNPIEQIPVELIPMLRKNILYLGGKYSNEPDR